MLCPSHNFPWKWNCVYCLHKIALRSLILGIALPVMAFTIITFPMVLFITIYSNIGDKMLQVLYIGGSKVSLPDACADVFQPRCSLNL